MPALIKNIGFNDVFRKVTIFMMRNVLAGWKVSRYFTKSSIFQTNGFCSASSLVHSNDDSLENDHSSIATTISSPQSLQESCRNSHSSNEKENVNNNSATAQPDPCACPFYSSQAAQSTVVNSGSVSSPIKRSLLTSISNLSGDTPK